MIAYNGEWLLYWWLANKPGYLLSFSRQLMTTAELTLEPASDEIKQSQRLKILAMVIGITTGLVWLGIVALALGPKVGEWLADHVGASRWLELLGMAAFLGITFEVVN